MGHSKGSPNSKVYRVECIYKRTKTFQISDLILQLKIPEIQEQGNPKTSRREIIKIRAESMK
jgi:hypothetical protein